MKKLDLPKGFLLVAQDYATARLDLYTVRESREPAAVIASQLVEELLLDPQHVVGFRLHASDVGRLEFVAALAFWGWRPIPFEATWQLFEPRR